MKKANDSVHVGKKFGRWTVREVDVPLARDRAWRCVCECGTESLVPRGNILKGASKGCINCRRMSGKSNPMWRGYGDVPQQYWYILNRGARDRDIKVAISIQDLQKLWEKQGGKCALTGLPIVLTTKRSGCTASVDRIDSEKGYTKGNIQWVHKDVNLMKNHFSEKRFMEICRLVASA